MAVSITDWLRATLRLNSSRTPTESQPAGRKPSSDRRFLFWLLSLCGRLNLLVFAALLAGLCSLDAAGRRTGLLTYHHGWPFTFLSRDFSESGLLSMSKAELHKLFMSMEGPSPSFELAAPSTEHELMLDAERRLNPWALNKTGKFNLWGAALDFFVVLAITAIIAKYIGNQFRGRILWQFRLRTAIGLMAIVAVVCAAFASWRDARDIERVTYAKVAECDQADSMKYPRAVASSGWHPPAWLPECIAKLPLFAPLFERIDDVDFMNSPTENLDQLSRMPYLVQLEIHEHGPYQNVFDGIVRLPSIESLMIDLDRCEGSDLAKLSRLPNLKCLDIRGDGFTNSVAEHVNRLPSLEQLEFRRTRCTVIKLHGLSKLRVLVVSTFSEDRHHRLFPQGIWPVVRLSDLPGIEKVAMEGVAVDDVLVSDLCNLPNLRHLTIRDSVSTVTGSPNYDGIPNEAWSKIRSAHPGAVIESR